MPMKALLNGKIYSSKGFYEAVLIENGKIKALGKNDQIKKILDKTLHHVLSPPVF